MQLEMATIQTISLLKILFPQKPIDNLYRPIPHLFLIKGDEGPKNLVIGPPLCEFQMSNVWEHIL